jgi:hypothetical protein
MVFNGIVNVIEEANSVVPDALENESVLKSESQKP